jgi:hypothetical protein
MSKRIPKKKPVVKSQKQKKPAKYKQKKDSLGRRYTVDVKTGKRVSNAFGDREKAKRKTTAKPVAPKAKKPRIPRNTKRQPKSKALAAAKKKIAALEKRLAERQEYLEQRRRHAEEAEEFIPISSIKGMVEDLRIRAKKYVRVQIALDRAADFARFESFEVLDAHRFGRPPTLEELIRIKLQDRLDNTEEDFDSIADSLANEYDTDISEIYEIYMSPDAA